MGTLLTIWAVVVALWPASFVGGIVWSKVVTPWREYKTRLAQTTAYKKEMEAKALEQERLKARQERLKAVQKASDQIGRKIVEKMTQFGVYYRYRKEETRERKGAHIQRIALDWEVLGQDFVVYHLKLPRHIRPSDMDDKFVEDLRIEVGRPDLQIIRTDTEGLFLFVPLYGARDGIPEIFHWQSKNVDYSAVDLMPSKSPFAVPIGLGANRRYSYLDVSNTSDDPHLLVGGSTGGGKSNLMNVILCSLLTKNTPETLQLALVDLKVVELFPYNDIPHLWRPVVNYEEGVLPLFSEIKNEINRRMKLFSSQKCRNINEWNKNNPEKAEPRLMLFVDELALVMQSCGAKAESLLSQICALGRAGGIHVFAFTQRPSVDVVTGLIKTNMTTRVALNTDEMGSRTILNNGMANGLQVKGRAIFHTKGEFISVQTPLITPEQINEVIKRCLEWQQSYKPIQAEQILEMVDNYPGRLELWKAVKAIDPRLTPRRFYSVLWAYQLAQKQEAYVGMVK